MPIKEFKVAAVSSNTNSFGLYGMLLLAKDREVWQVGANNLHVKKVGDIVEVRVDEVNSEPDFTSLSYEIPQRMPDCTQKLADEIWCN